MVARINNWISNPENQVRTAVGGCITAAINSYFGPFSWIGCGATIVGGQLIVHEPIRYFGDFCKQCVKSAFFTCRGIDRALKEWVDQKIGDPEYQSRILAAQKIKDCYSLKNPMLDLSNNFLTSLPDAIGDLRSLQELYLFGNQLEGLPDAIGDLSSLQRLYLSGNQLRSLPDAIGDLRSLQRLELSGNQQLDALPRNITLLGGQCNVYLENVPLSSNVLTRLTNEVNNENYQGPQFHYSIQERDAGTLGLPFNELVKRLYTFVQKKESQNLDFSQDQKEKLRSWLAKLSWIADFKKDGQQKRNLATKVIEYLEFASTNKVFQEEVFFAIIEEASTTCGDRMALSVIHLGIAKRLTESENETSHNIQKLENLLIHGSWTLEQLETAAKEKVVVQRFVDELQVYLGFLIPQTTTFSEDQKQNISFLQQQLAIPLDVEEMLYFASSSLSYNDLKKAYESILTQRKDPEKVNTFLAKNDYWRKALKKINPGKYTQALLSDKPIVVLTKWTQEIRKGAQTEEDEYKI